MIAIRVEKTAVHPSHGSRGPVLNLSPVHSVVSLGIVEALGPKKPLPTHLLPEPLALVIPHVIDGGLASKDTSPSLGLGGRCRAGWRVGWGKFQLALSPTGVCI